MEGIASAIEDGWELLAAQLDIPLATLTHIKMNPQYSIAKQIYCMLVAWRESAADGATLNALFVALREASPNVTVNWNQLETNMGFPRISGSNCRC